MLNILRKCQISKPSFLRQLVSRRAHHLAIAYLINERAVCTRPPTIQRCVADDIAFWNTEIIYSLLLISHHPPYAHLTAEMVTEENAALRQKFDLLKGAEQHKNALIEVDCLPFSQSRKAGNPYSHQDRNCYAVLICSLKITARRN